MCLASQVLVNGLSTRNTQAGQPEAKIFGTEMWRRVSNYTMTRITHLLILIAIALCGVIGYLWLQLNQERMLRAQLSAHASELEVSLLAENTRRHTKAGIEIESAEAKAKQTTLVPMKSLKSRESSSTPMASRARDIDSSTSPRTRSVRLSEQRASMRRMFPDLAAVLRLDERASNSLIDLLAEHALQAEENPPFVPEGELDWDEGNKPEWVRKLELARQRHENEIAQLLGEDIFPEWKEYAATASARSFVRDFRTSLDGTADPLRADQMPQLVTAVADAQHRYSLELRYSPSSTSAKKQLERYYAYLREAAAPYISTDQRHALDRFLEQQLEPDREFSDGDLSAEDANTNSK